jgi:hypothetical protein
LPLIGEAVMQRPEAWRRRRRGGGRCKGDDLGLGASGVGTREGGMSAWVVLYKHGHVGAG